MKNKCIHIIKKSFRLCFNTIKEDCIGRVKMRRIVWACILFCSVCVHANIVPLTLNYTGQIDSFFRSGDNVYTLSGTTTNGSVSKVSTDYPYTGGMTINNREPEEILISPSETQIGALFGTDGNVECWGEGEVRGTIEIEETLDRPQGTPYDLQIKYTTASISVSNDGTLPSFYLTRGAALLDEDYNIIWDAVYSANQIDTYSVPIVTGAIYHFHVWVYYGASSNPVTADFSGHTGQAVAIDFSVVPEPATLLLVGIGAAMIKRRK